ncbi:MAG: type III secretion system export apparatus subunit SctT [Alphaproteobacteria bacterium GM7ARS4]|nr:type III secretion system export apparatus subunit SctT [Alphaproteobacteria bacterium GM7ARS4]
MVDLEGIEQLAPFVKSLMLGTARMIGFFLFLPVLSPQWVSGAMRTAVIIALSSPIIVHVHTTFHEAGFTSHISTMFFIIKEVALGVLLGFGSALIFWAVQASGFLIDNQRGATIASSYDPLSGNQASPIGMMMLNVFIMYFILSGGLLILLSALYISYGFWPVESVFPRITFSVVLFMLERLDFLARLAVLIAAPVVMTMMLSEFALALVSRFATQLNVFSVAFSIKSGIAIFMLYLYVGILFPYLRREFFEIEFTIEALEVLVQ